MEYVIASPWSAFNECLIKLSVTAFGTYVPLFYLNAMDMVIQYSTVPWILC